MKLKVLSAAVAGVAVTLLGSAASAQVVGSAIPTFTGGGTTPGWIAPFNAATPATSGPYSWLANDNNVRGMSYNPATGTLLVVSRTGGTNIRVLDGTTGNLLRSMNTTTNTITGGTFSLNNVTVTDDGVVYAANLTTNSSASPFKVYRWASDSDTAVPSNVYSGNAGLAGARVGDSISNFRGNDAGGTIAFGHAAGAASGTFTATASNTFSVFTTQGNDTVAPTAVVPTLAAAIPAGAFRLGMANIDGNTFLGRQSDAFVRSASVSANAVIGAITTSGGSERGMTYKEINGFKMLAVVDTNSSITRFFDLGDVSISGVQTVTELGNIRLLATATNNANGNASSAITWGSSSGRTATIYSMATNNGIQGISLAVPYKAGWQVDADGAYNTATNWSVGVPNQAGDIAIFGSTITAPRTVTVDAPVSARELRFDNGNSYTVNGTSQITLSPSVTSTFNGSSTVSFSSILRVTQGNHTINAPMRATTGVALFLPSGSTLEVNRLTSADGRTINLNSSSTNGGVLKVKDLLQFAGLTMPPTTDTPISIDLTTGGMVVVRQFASGYGQTGDAALREMVRSWWNNGSKNGVGIGSSVAATNSGADAYTTLAVFTNNDNTEATTNAYYGTYRGISVFNSQSIVAYTYLGDTNIDGVVDGKDLANFLEAYTLGGLSGWRNGDFNYDGAIDTTDFGLLQASISANLPAIATGVGFGSPSGAIPEPAAAGLLAAALPLATRRRNRRR